MTPIRYSGKVKNLRKYLKELEDKQLNSKVLSSGTPGILRSINYRNKTATVEIDYEYLVEYPWDKVVVKEGGQA